MTFRPHVGAKLHQPQFPRYRADRFKKSYSFSISYEDLIVMQNSPICIGFDDLSGLNAIKKPGNRRWARGRRSRHNQVLIFVAVP